MINGYLQYDIQQGLMLLNGLGKATEPVPGAKAG